MDKKQRFFIYDRKEVGVLLLLGVLVAVFAFTLGVHFGKRVTGKSAGPTVPGHPTETVTPVAEVSHGAEAEQMMTQPSGTPSALATSAEHVMNQALEDEVARTGIQLDEPRQLELPEKAKAKNEGATTPEAQPSGNRAEPDEAVSAKGIENRPAVNPHRSTLAPGSHEGHETLGAAEVPRKATRPTAPIAGQFTLQIGSYASPEEAQSRIKDLEISGLEARIQETQVKGKGRWYRIYLGGFATRGKAQKAGEKYRKQGVIDSFIVSKSME